MPTLEQLAEKCLRLGLIDDFTREGDDITIVRHGIVRFKLDPDQAHAFLTNLLRTGQGGVPDAE